VSFQFLSENFCALSASLSANVLCRRAFERTAEMEGVWKSDKDRKQGRLKMRDRKMRNGQKCRGGKCRTGEIERAKDCIQVASVRLGSDLSQLALSGDKFWSRVQRSGTDRLSQSLSLC